MAPATIPTALPLRLTAGDTWRWDRVVNGYTPAAGWTLVTYLRGASNVDCTGVASSDNQSWENTVSATATKTVAAGQYEWSEFLTNGAGERYAVLVDGKPHRGILTIEANPALVNAGDRVSFEEANLPRVECAIQDALVTGFAKVQIGTRGSESYSLAELMAMRDRFKSAIRARRHQGRRPPLVPEFR